MSPRAPKPRKPPRTPIPGCPNDLDDLPTRIRNAKTFLDDNPDEQQSTAASIYNLWPTTLNSSIKRKYTRKQHGGQNKILKDYHERALHAFILQCIANWLLLTAQLIFNVICTIKRGVDKNFKAPFISWFSRWWQKSGLYKIKTKPLARVRISAQDQKEIKKWFKDYRRTLKRHKFKRKDIINFDKTGFRIGCPRGSWILVPEFIKEV
jgi:hypothetical protein